METVKDKNDEKGVSIQTCFTPEFLTLIMIRKFLRKRIKDTGCTKMN